ncbi:DMT family transporter [Rhodoplanes azumiensis]|uniref:DMT family transporter n=1 Tax=Rhodoplanes azumiensis TaxID=1897628 RepID=A0ABW5AGK4_9BRAD
MNSPSSTIGRKLFDYGPGLTAAVSFAGADVLTKLGLMAGSDVITLATTRSILGIGLTALWIALGPTPLPLTRDERRTAYGMGVLYAGIIFFIFKAIELLTVPMAILVYFSYPLVTGMVGAALGLDKLGWRGLLAAFTAFCGLALMIGASPSDLSIAGLLCTMVAMACRVAVLIVSRQRLMKADARLSTWYSAIATALLFCGGSLVTLHFVPPVVTIGWLWIVLLGVTTTTGVAVIFISTTRIGPFRTALTMNLEPLLATLLSAAFLGEVFSPVQALGAAIMIASLFAFQLRR